MDTPSPNQVLASVERTIAEASGAGRIAVIFQAGDQISIRDNSGIAGLCGEPMMDATEKLLSLCFPDFSRSKKQEVPSLDLERIARSVANYEDSQVGVTYMDRVYGVMDILRVELAKQNRD